MHVLEEKSDVVSRLELNRADLLSKFVSPLLWFGSQYVVEGRGPHSEKWASAKNIGLY